MFSFPSNAIFMRLKILIALFQNETKMGFCRFKLKILEL